MGYSNSKSVSSYAFGVPTNLHSIHGSIKVTQYQVAGKRRGERAVHVWAAARRRGKGTEGGRPPEPMPRVGACDLPEGSAAAALHGGADPPCDCLIKQ